MVVQGGRLQVLFTGLTPATYNVQIRDKAHILCVVVLDAALVITEPPVLSATVNSTDVTCNGAANGTITITNPLGGYGTYAYTVNGGASWQSSGNFTNLAPGTYNVRIRDAANTACVITLNAALLITQPPVLSATVTSTNVTCNGANDGTITITNPLGGYGTYEYSVNGGTAWQASGNFTVADTGVLQCSDPRCGEYCMCCNTERIAPADPACSSFGQCCENKCNMQWRK